MHGVAQVQMLGDGSGIRRIMVHVVPLGNLGGAAMAAAVMRHHAVAMLEEEEQLRVPVVGGKRPAMVKHDRLGIARAPILIENFCVVGGRDIRHDIKSFSISS